MTAKPFFKTAILYGKVEISSWLEYKDGKFIGMGGATYYDKDGNVTGHSVSPTGLVIDLDNGNMQATPKRQSRLRRILSRWFGCYS